ncbi:protein ImuA [Sphingobium faniae]|nr:protein ImuA [Sphingobium faniae]
MIESAATLTALRRRIASLESRSVAHHAHVPLGHALVDRALGGGLARGRVHEFFAGEGGEAAATGFSLILARLAGPDAVTLWLRPAAAARQAAPYGPGLAALGIDPAHLLVGAMRDEAMLLRAAVEALRCPALGALLLEIRGRAPQLDLTASRRLSLAAEQSGVTALLLRMDADPTPSAADTRWRVAAAPSAPLPGNAPGMSAFDLTLLRHRGGRDGMAWRLIWDSERRQFGDGRDERDDHEWQGRERDGGAPLSRPVLSFPAVRPVAGRAA